MYQRMVIPLKIVIRIEQNYDNSRLDSIISQEVEQLSRSQIQNLIESGNVFVNGKAVLKSYKLKMNDLIEIDVPEPKKLDIVAQDIPLDIVFEDKDLLVCNKVQGMVVHPAAGNYEGTLVNALMSHCGESLSGINGVMRPGIVHRIDKDTSGLLIVAKNDLAHKSLAAQIKAHTFTRIYEAVVCGRIKEESGTINAPIGRNKIDRKKMAVTEKNAKSAITHFETIKIYDRFTHIRLKLETGRTHQIRVHMAHIGHPIAGDPVYGLKKNETGLKGQCLHAKVIGFIHPRTNEYLEFDSPLPEYFVDFLKRIGN
jgi:23S rRNA pseudouridine1911/1915/1917 synthase